MKRRRSSSSLWLELPDHVMSLVAEKLMIHVEDYIRFGAVCRSWHFIYTGNRHRLPNQLPMLMLPTDPNVNNKKRSFYSLTKKAVIDFQVLLPHYVNCRGSSHGWLVTVHLYEVHLYNPFVSVKKVIKLPPLTAFESDTDGIGIECSDYLQKVVLSSNPRLNPKRCVAMAIYGSHERLAYCVPGDKAWTSLPDCGPIQDVIHCKDQFYAVNKSGQVFAWHWNHRNPSVSIISPPLESHHARRYLVESSGDLLQFLRDKRNNFSTFTVFRLDQNEAKWSKMDHIPGRVVFLGDNSSLSLSASDFPECKGDSIYFTDEDYITEGCHIEQLYGPGQPQDIGVFSFKDRQTDRDHPWIPMISIPVPIWIEPTL